LYLGIFAAKNKEIGKIVLIPVSRIVSNPNQPRRYFDQKALQELCRSIATSGLLQPVTVRRQEDDHYELVAGERRTMAYRTLGRDCIPAIIEDYSDEQSAVLALVENLQRKDLNYFEEALGIARLMRELQITQAEVSQRIGKAQSTVANKLRLLKYPDHLQKKMLQGGLTERHARAMLKIEEVDLREMVVDYVTDNQLTVEQTEQYIETLYEERNKPRSTKVFVVKDMRIFLNSINKAVDMMRASGIPVNVDKNEDESYLEYNLRIPKKAVLHNTKEEKKEREMVKAGPIPPNEVWNR